VSCQTISSRDLYPLHRGETFWIDEAWLSSQDAPRPKRSSAPLVTALIINNYEKDLTRWLLPGKQRKSCWAKWSGDQTGIPRFDVDLKIKQSIRKTLSVRALVQLQNLDSKTVTQFHFEIVL